MLERYRLGKHSKAEERILEDFFDSYQPNDQEEWPDSDLGDKKKFKEKLYLDVKKEMDSNTRTQDWNLTKRLLRYVAAVALLVGIGLGFLFLDSDTQKETKLAWIEKSTKAGERMSVKLPDGSFVKLNANSSLKFPKGFEADKRQVVLEGEAFFDVAKDAERPFVITSSEILTTVLGTSFNVNAYSENRSIEVSVLTGKVKVVHGTKENVSAFLVPNKKAIYSKEKGEMIVDSFASEMLGWKDGIVIFRQASRSEVVKTLQNWYGVKIHFQNDDMRPWDLTATFDNQSLKTVMESLAHTANFTYEIDRKDIRINFKKSAYDKRN